jgi:hypothetical protein
VGGNECYASPAGVGIGALTPSSVKASDKAALREAMLHRNEEIALLRAVNEELRETNEKIAVKLTEVEQVVDAVAPPLDGPSDTVRSLAERMMGLKKMLQNTKNSLNPHASESPGLANKGAEEVRRCSVSLVASGGHQQRCVLVVECGPVSAKRCLMGGDWGLQQASC